MKVLMLSQFYPPIVGGQERHVRSLAIGLTGRGHHVDVLTIAPIGQEPGVEVDEGVRVHRVRSATQRLPFLYSDPLRPHAMPIPDPGLSSAIRRMVAATKYDVLHAHDWTVSSALRPARRHGTPVVYTLHDYSHICATKRLMRGDEVCAGPGPVVCVRCAAGQYGAVGAPVVLANAWARTRRRAGVSTFIPVSAAVARSTRLDAGTFTVVPNFIPDGLVHDVVVARPDGPVVFVGDLSHDKGVSVLLDAHRSMSPSPRLVLAGRQFPEAPVDDAPGVELAGVLPYDEVLDLIGTASVVVVPSIVADCSPTVVLEAMAAGRPVVASATGGIVDQVVDGVTGVLVPPEDPVALRRAIQSVLADPGMAAAMGRAGWERVREFTSSAILSRIVEVYRQAGAAGPG